jgi:hypothetical protein
MKICKYTMDQSIQTIALPVGSSIIKVDQQDNQVKMWALTPATEASELRTFEVIPTGCDVPVGFNYLGTAILHGGSLVLHVFEHGKWVVR